jgi:hypothetical protein
MTTNKTVHKMDAQPKVDVTAKADRFFMQDMGNKNNNVMMNIFELRVLYHRLVGVAPPPQPGLRAMW